jgi:hypothetical protein
MSRLEWILGIALVILLGVVIVLSLLFWFRPDAPVASGPGDTAAILAERADDIAPTSVFEGRTAQFAFAAAQRAALEWKSDAALISASATWPQGASQQELLTGETNWEFTFYTPAENSVAQISVLEDEATFRSEMQSAQTLQPMQASGWTIDSRDVMRQFLDQRGSAFMGENGVTTLTMMLSADGQQGRIEWLVSLFATQTGKSLTMRFDATTGEVIEILEL